MHISIPKVPTQKDYKLLTKITKADIKNLDDNKLEIPLNAVSYDLVQIGKESDKTFLREVLSFFDKDNKVTSRLYKENGKNILLREYKHEPERRIIESKIFMTYDNAAKIGDNIGYWLTKSIEYLNVKKDKSFVKKTVNFLKHQKTQASIFLKKIEFLTPDQSLQKITYSHFYKDKSRNQKKFISADFANTIDGYKMSHLKKSKNLALDLSDKFLKIRLLNPKSFEGLIAYTKSLLAEKGLKSLNIKIHPYSNKVSSYVYGYFSSPESEICYGKRLLNETSEEVIDTVAHEVEHAYQYALIGRLGKGNTSYENEALKKLGEIPKEKRAEAIDYAIAKERYQQFSKIGNAEYHNNLLEIRAADAGKDAAMEYKENVDNYNFFKNFE